MKTLMQIVVAALLPLTALAEDVRTFEEMGQQPLPPADFVVTIENNQATICNSAMEVLGVAVTKPKQKIPTDKNGLREFTLGLMAYVMRDDGIYLIINDEFEAWYYKAAIKRVSPDEVIPVHTPNPKGT